jgi:hypothetical protein
MANIGLAQVRGRDVEPGIATCGDDLTGLTRFMPAGTTRYGAADVIATLLGLIAPNLSNVSQPPTAARSDASAR